jgi:hypothetical protein
MASAQPGGKGYDLEDALKAYFWRAGYFVVRGVPYRVEGEDVTDVDLWLYERPAALTRRRLVVDVKNRKSPKVFERLIWCKGLQAALGIDGAIVASTDNRASARRLSKSLNVTLLDGDAVTKLVTSEQLKNVDQIRSLEFDDAVKRIDESRHSVDWRRHIQDARASLISGIGVQSTNTNLAASAFFAEQVLAAHPRSEQAQVAVRLFYFCSALAAISLDYMLADQAFQTPDERRKSIIGGIRFGHSDAPTAPPAVRAAVALARKYAENGNAIAKQIEYGFYGEADRIPAEIIADYVARISASDALFTVAREIERASMSTEVPSYDQMSSNAKSLLGVFLDFNAISRERIATAWPRGEKTLDVKRGGPPPPTAGDAGPLFTDTEPRTGPGSTVPKGTGQA